MSECHCFHLIRSMIYEKERKRKMNYRLSGCCTCIPNIYSTERKVDCCVHFEEQRRIRLTNSEHCKIYIQPKSEVIICESLALFTCFNNISCKNNVFKYENGDLEKFNGEQSFFFFVICKYLEYFSSFVYVCTTVNGGMYYKNIVILCCVCEKNT